MNILITGSCGFVGSTVLEWIQRLAPDLTVYGLDNLSRTGSEINLFKHHKHEVTFYRSDIRLFSDLETLPDIDWVIDCAANPSVLAGVNEKTSSRQLLEHNLLGTINLLELCKDRKAGLILLSTSRVYSAKDLATLPVTEMGDQYALEQNHLGTGLSEHGIAEDFPTTAPISLYGASKLASEALILEYGEAFDFPVWINRCGVLAGAGQFGMADQGIFSYWIHSFREKRPLKYVGFGGSGLQVRDALHPCDLAPLLLRQMNEPSREAPRTLNLGGGVANSMSLKQLSTWCNERFENKVKVSDEERPYDAPWIVMDSSLASEKWNWRPETKLEEILEEIAAHAEEHPNWLALANS